MATYLITGAARGLGLALVSQLASLDPSEVKVVFATSREKEPASVKELAESLNGRVVSIHMDPNSPSSIQKAEAEVESRLDGDGLDVLINNVGVQPYVRNGIASMENLTDTFNTNVITAHMVTRAFIPLLQMGQRKVVVNISSTLGSIAMANVFKPSPTPAYKISKAALNMLTVQYAEEYANQGFTFFVVSPGWLRTDMGGEIADLPVETGAEAVIKIVRNAGPEQNGHFLNIHVPGWENNPGLNKYDGKEVPW